MVKRGIRVIHNKTLFIVIIILLVLFGVMIGVSYNFVNSQELECKTDSDCVPAECCHPKTCTAEKNKPDCSAVLCTASCEPGTLDCNQGSCLCVNGRCRAEIK